MLDQDAKDANARISWAEGIGPMCCASRVAVVVVVVNDDAAGADADATTVSVAPAPCAAGPAGAAPDPTAKSGTGSAQLALRHVATPRRRALRVTHSSQPERSLRVLAPGSGGASQGDAHGMGVWHASGSGCLGGRNSCLWKRHWEVD